MPEVSYTTGAERKAPAGKVCAFFLFRKKFTKNLEFGSVFVGRKRLIDIGAADSIRGNLKRGRASGAELSRSLFRCVSEEIMMVESSPVGIEPSFCVSEKVMGTHRLAFVVVIVLLATVATEAVQDKGAPAKAQGPDIAQLITKLGSDEPVERKEANQSLAKVGEAALPALRKAMMHEDAEIRRAAAELIETIEEQLGKESRAAIHKAGGAIKENADDSTLSIRLSHTKAKDADLRYVRYLRHIKEIDLSWTEVTDAGLAHLCGQGELENLNLAYTKITGEGLKNLNDAGNLRLLVLTESAVTDAGLASLHQLKGLEQLYLDGTKISDLSLTQLKDMKSLRRLLLSATKVKGSGLVHLKGLHELEELDLLGSALTDEEVANLSALKELKKLKHLDLGWTDLTDAAVVHLKILENVEIVNLNASEITPQAIAELRKAQPGTGYCNSTPRKNGVLIVNTFRWTGKGKNGKWTDPKNWMKLYASPPSTSRGYPGQDGVVTDNVGIGSTEEIAITLDQSVQLGGLYIDRKVSLTVDGKSLTIKPSEIPCASDGFCLAGGTLNLKNGASLELSNLGKLATWKGGAINASPGKEYQGAVIYINQGTELQIGEHAKQLGASLNIGSCPTPNPTETLGIVHIGAMREEMDADHRPSSLTLYNNASITVGTKGQLNFDQTAFSDRLGGIMLDPKGSSKDSHVTNNGELNRLANDNKDLILTIKVPVVQENANAVSSFAQGARVNFAAGFEVKAGELRGISAAIITGIKKPLPRGVKTSFLDKGILDSPPVVVGETCLSTQGSGHVTNCYLWSELR